SDGRVFARPSLNSGSTREPLHCVTEPRARPPGMRHEQPLPTHPVDRRIVWPKLPVRHDTAVGERHALWRSAVISRWHLSSCHAPAGYERRGCGGCCCDGSGRGGCCCDGSGRGGCQSVAVRVVITVITIAVIGVIPGPAAAPAPTGAAPADSTPAGS